MNGRRWLGSVETILAAFVRETSQSFATIWRPIDTASSYSGVSIKGGISYSKSST